MLNPRTVTLFGYGSLLIMTGLFFLVLFKQVPQSWYWSMFLIAATLFFVRLTLRLILARQQRIAHAKGPKGKESAGTPPVSQ